MSFYVFGGVGRFVCMGFCIYFLMRLQIECRFKLVWSWVGGHRLLWSLGGVFIRWCGHGFVVVMGWCDHEAVVWSWGGMVIGWCGHGLVRSWGGVVMGVVTSWCGHGVVVVMGWCGHEVVWS